MNTFICYERCTTCKKAQKWTYERDGFINLNVKVEPDKAFFWRDIYESVVPGYHQNKEHWNTIIEPNHAQGA